MKDSLKFERYTFAAILLIFAAIILISLADMPSEGSVEVSGVVVKNQETTSSTTNKESETTQATETEKTNGSSTLINLNTATIEELDTLKGIGESRAKSIIAYRNKLGGYTSIEQIKDISGIGDSIFENIRDRITV